jgi:membrane protease YdiL (CAAX protease family)
MNLKAIVQRRPLIIYFVLAYAIAWGGTLLVAGATRLQGSAISSTQLALVMLMMLLGPSTAGVLVTAIVSGREGLRDLWARMRRWRVGGRWYGVAVLTNPLALLGVLYVLTVFVSPDYRPGFNLLFGLVAGGLAGFFEEIGWSGFATPRLLQRYSVVRAGLLLGVLWGLWHGMAGFMGSTPGQEAFWLVEFILFWVVTLTAYRILMTWVYSHTGSILVAQIMHAFFTGTLVVVLPLLSQRQTLLYELIFAACLWGLVAVVAIAHRRAQAQPTLEPQVVA